MTTISPAAVRLVVGASRIDVDMGELHPHRVVLLMEVINGWTPPTRYVVAISPGHLLMTAPFVFASIHLCFGQRALRRTLSRTTWSVVGVLSMLVCAAAPLMFGVSPAGIWDQAAAEPESFMFAALLTTLLVGVADGEVSRLIMKRCDWFAHTATKTGTVISVVSSLGIVTGILGQIVGGNIGLLCGAVIGCVVAVCSLTGAAKLRCGECGELIDPPKLHQG